MKKIFLTSLGLIVFGLLSFINTASAIAPETPNSKENILITVISPKPEETISGEIKLLVNTLKDSEIDVDIATIDEPLVLTVKASFQGEKPLIIGEGNCEIKNECLVSLWDTTKVKNGQYEIFVTNSDNTYVSKSIFVTINNISTPIDTTPIVTEFVIPDNSTSLNINITKFEVQDDSETGLLYALTENNQIPTSEWTTIKPTSYTFADVGSKTLYAWVKDAGENISTPKIANIKITNRRKSSTTGGYLPNFSINQEEGRVLGAEKFIFTLPLALGTKGNEVTELHKRLIADGYLKITAPTGYFGPLTLKAVKEFQLTKGLISDGIVGPLTRAELNK